MSELPPEILGRMAPLLCWVEGAEGLRLPPAWIAERIPFRDREKAWLVREFPTYSYDTVDDILRLRRSGPRSKAAYRPWQSSTRENRRSMAPPQGYDIMDELGHLASRYFCWRGNELVVREQRLVELHELALRLPVRHLIRHAHARAVIEGHLRADRARELPESLGQLHTTSRSLRAVVERGVSEGHLHLWGVLSGDEGWADHLLRFLSPGALEGFKAAEERLLILGRVAIRLLAFGLLSVHFGSTSDRLPFHLIRHLDQLYHVGNRSDEKRIVGRLRAHFKQELRFLTRQRIPREGLNWLLRLLDPTIYHLRHLTRRFSTDNVRQRINLLNRLHFTVHRELLRLDAELGHDEERSQRQVLASDPSSQLAYQREFLHQAYFRYLVFHTHHWQQATQSGKTTGLRQFRRFFSARQRKLLERNSIAEHGLILERLSQTRALDVVEGRVSPPERGAIDLTPWILGYRNCRRRGELRKFGFIVHFKKQEIHEQDAARADGGRRYGQIRRQTRTNAFQLFRLLRTPHPVVPFIVGIDAASLELHTPPEVFAPAFRFLRDFPIELRHDTLRASFPYYRSIQVLVEERQLGMTYHVGEDFRHLLSGLRAIHEVVEFLNPRPGDRIGHAIALALEPNTWASQIGYQALVPKLEWLDDLVWLHHLLGPGHDLVGELEVEDSIQRLSREIYCSRPKDSGRKSLRPTLNLAPPTLHDAWRLRQLDPFSINPRHLAVGHCEIGRSQHGHQERRWAESQKQILTNANQHIGSDDAFKLLGLYWYDPEVRSKGQEIVAVDMAPRRKLWLQVCLEAQAKIQKLVQDRQLIVEVNPTINRVVGPMGRLAEHHIFRMTLDEKKNLKPGIRVTVNTDDPGVVDTSLTHEYYLLGENLLKNEVAETRVEDWLEWLRKNGSHFSFLSVLPDSPEDPRYQHVEQLLDWLHTMHPRLARRVEGLPPQYRPHRPRMLAAGSGSRRRSVPSRRRDG